MTSVWQTLGEKDRDLPSWSHLQKTVMLCNALLVIQALLSTAKRHPHIRAVLNQRAPLLHTLPLAAKRRGRSMNRYEQRLLPELLLLLRQDKLLPKRKYSFYSWQSLNSKSSTWGCSDSYSGEKLTSGVNQSKKQWGKRWSCLKAMGASQTRESTQEQTKSRKQSKAAKKANSKQRQTE